MVAAQRVVHQAVPASRNVPIALTFGLLHGLAHGVCTASLLGTQLGDEAQALQGVYMVLASLAGGACTPPTPAPARARRLQPNPSRRCSRLRGPMGAAGRRPARLGAAQPVGRRRRLLLAGPGRRARRVQPAGAAGRRGALGVRAGGRLLPLEPLELLPPLEPLPPLVLLLLHDARCANASTGNAARPDAPGCAAHLQGGLVALDALLADSSPTGARSGLFTALFAASEGARWLGAALVGALPRYKDAQAGQQVPGCLLLGSALAVLPALLVLWLDDGQALGQESAGVLDAGRRPAAQGQQRALAPSAGAADEEAAEAGEAAPVHPWLAPVRTTVAGGAGGVGSFWIDVDEHDAPSSAGTAAPVGSLKAQLAASHPLLLSPGSTPASPWHHAGPFSGAADERQEPGSSASCTSAAAALQQLLPPPPPLQQQQQPGPGSCSGCAQHGGGPALEDVPAIVASGSPCRRLQPAMAPICLLASELATGLASGLSLSLMPRILRDELQLDTAAVQAVYIKAGLLTCAAAVLAQRISRLLGRAQAILAFKAAGISLLWLLGARGWWSSAEGSTITWLFICR
jgi:hypothetical protein